MTKCSSPRPAYQPPPPPPLPPKFTVNVPSAKAATTTSNPSVVRVLADEELNLLVVQVKVNAVTKSNPSPPMHGFPFAFTLGSVE